MLFNANLPNNPNILSIFVDASHYEAGYVSIHFRPHAIDKRDAFYERLSAKLAGIPIYKKDNNIICTDFANLNNILEDLIVLDWLTADDRSVIASIKQKIDEIMKLRDGSTYDITKDQEAILTTVDDVCIKDIITTATNYQHAVALFRAAFLFTGHPEHKKRMSFYTNKGHDFQSVLELSQLIRGKANLETTLGNMGPLPTLDMQRVVVLNHCLDKLTLKYNHRLDDANKLIMYMAMHMLAFDTACMPFDSFEELVRDALQGHEAAMSCFKPDIQVVLSKSFASMDILNDMERIEALRKKFESPVIAAYLDLTKKNRIARNNPLLVAIRNDDPAEITKILSANPALVHSPLQTDSRTPLIMVVSQASVESVKAVLSFKQDLNAFNALDAYNSMAAAIYRKSFIIFNLLVNEGADVFAYCRNRIMGQGRFFGENTSVSDTPLKLAIDLYRKDKQPELKEIICALFKMGAAMCFDFTQVDTEVLKWLDRDTIAVGAIFPKDFACDAITTASAFVARVPKEKYFDLHHAMMIALQQEESKFAGLRQIFFHVGVYVGALPTCQRHPEFKPYMDAMDEFKYSRALRRACVIKDHHLAYLLACGLLRHAKSLQIDLYETNSEQMTAYDYAKRAGNDMLCEAFIERGYRPPGESLKPR